MPYYQVTLNQGRTDTVTIEADSIKDIKSFFDMLSTANITMIKEVVYSQKLLNSPKKTEFIKNKNFKYLNVMVRSKNKKVLTIDIKYPKNDIKQKDLVKQIKKKLLLFDDEIIEVLNVLVKK
jgi:hypothetical protein